MPANKQRSASSVADFLSVVTELRKEWCEEDKKEWKSDDKDFEPSQFWFRGVSRPTYELKPKVYRKSGFDAVRKYPRTEFNENEIRRGFKSCGSQLMTEPHLPEDQKGWYFLMQHYRAPTRLIDWTDGALLGLYFAVRTLKKPRDAAVWMLDPARLNKSNDMPFDGVALPEWKETNAWFPKPFSDILHPKLPLAIDPPHVARRLAVQRSHFTIHGTDKNALDKMSRRADSRLVKITIRKDGIVEILDDLETCGISETTVFPDLEGLALELERKW